VCIGRLKSNYHPLLPIIKNMLIGTKKILNEFFALKDLEDKERNKSLDYWERYTAAVRKLVIYLKK